MLKSGEMRCSLLLLLIDRDTERDRLAVDTEKKRRSREDKVYLYVSSVQKLLDTDMELGAVIRRDEVLTAAASYR